MVRGQDINSKEELEFCESKDEVFSRFQEWKAEVERSTRRQVKTLHSDNGGEYTSKEFTSYLAKERIKHELTIPHAPQQNGVAERLNRTLIEGVHTMLANSKLLSPPWCISETAVQPRHQEE